MAVVELAIGALTKAFVIWMAPVVSGSFEEVHDVASTIRNIVAKVW